MKKRLLIPLVLTSCLLTALLTCCLCISYAEPTRPRKSALHPHTQEAELRQDVEALCREPRYGASIEHARQYIIDQLRAAGWEAKREAFTVLSEGDSGREETRYNITAYRPGAQSKSRYIIGAHYDACDTGQGNPGADDNASAVAALLSIARRLPREQAQVGLELVFYDCEEPPWFDTASMGSAVHAARCTPEEVRGMICLEMLGYYSDEEDSQPSLFFGHSLLLPTVGNFIAVVGNMDAWSLARQAAKELRRSMPTLRLNIPFAQDTGLFFSDHRNYAPLGIPAIMVTDTAMLRNANYHEATDTPETLDYRRMASVTQGIIRLIRQLAYEADAHGKR